jgi:hypothetical protein
VFFFLAWFLLTRGRRRVREGLPNEYLTVSCWTPARPSPQGEAQVGGFLFKFSDKPLGG